MKTYRRQRQQYLFATLLGVFAVVNLLFFFILYQPARSEYYRLQDSVEHMRSDIQNRQQRIQQLDRLNAQLSTLEQDRTQLFMMHFIPRSAGWSEILPKLNTMIQDAHVDNTHKDYSIEPSPQFGLYSVKMRIPVQGPYPNVVNFIKDLEDSQTFFVINSIDIHGSSSVGNPTGTGSPDITLGLNVETFFYQ